MREKPEQRTHRFKASTIVLFVLGALAVLGLIFSTGKYLSLPFQSVVTVEQASSESHCSTGGAIVDRSSTRLILLDANNEISYIVSTDYTSDKPYFYGSVVAADDGVYVQRYLYAQSSDYIKQGQIVKYSYDGQILKTFAQYDLDTMGERVLQPLVTSMTLEDTTLHVCTCNPLASRSSHYDVDVTSDDTASLDSNYVVRYEQLPDDVAVIYAQYDAKSKTTYFVDQLGRCYSDDVANDYRTNFEQIDVQGSVDNLLYFDTSCEPVKAVSQTDSEGKNFSYILPLFLRMCWFWISVVVAVLIGLYLLGRGIYKSVKTKNYTVIRRAAIVVTGCAVAVGVVAFYAYNMFSDQQSSKTKTLSTVCITMASSYTDSFASAAAEFETNGSLSASTYERISSTLEQRTHDAALTSNEVIYSLIVLKNGKAYQLADSSSAYISGEDISSSLGGDFWSLLSNGSSGKTVATSSEKNARGNYIMAACPVLDDTGTTVAILTAGDSLVTSSSKNLRSQITLLVSLLAIAVSISFLVMEGRTWAIRLAERARRRREGTGNEEFFLVRVLNFVGMCACSVDSALVVLIANDMLAGTPLEGNSLILMLPPMLTTVGYLVGTMAFGALMPRIRAKTLFIASCVVSIIAFGGCACSVVCANVIALSVCLLVANAGLQIFAVALGGMSAYTTDSTIRTMLRQDGSEAYISSYALVSIAASFAATNLGDAFVYILGSLLVGLLLVFVVMLFPRESAFDRQREKESKTRKKFSLHSPETKATLQLISNPVIITLFLGIGLTINLTGGFKSFLFPLIANNDGFDKSAIAQIMVFCSAVAFYLSPAVVGLQKKLGIRKSLYVTTAIIGLLFIAFLGNSSLLWAVVVLAATTLLAKILNSGHGSIWVEMIDKTGTPPAIGVSAKELTGSIRSIATSPIMGVLALLGGVWSCVVLGVYAIIGSISFWIACRHDERQTDSSGDSSHS